MITWALALIAIGIASLVGVSIWPVVLIAFVASILLSYALRGYPETARMFNCWQCCWPSRNELEGKETRTG